MGEERRKFPRQGRKFLVKFRAIGGPAPRDIADRLGEVLDVSKGGLRIASKRDLPPGTLLRIQVPENALGKSRELNGRICWTEAADPGADSKMGVMFVRIGAAADKRGASRQALKLLLKIRCPIPGIFYEELSRGGQLLNLSEGGMEISSPREYPPGTELEIQLPESPLGSPKKVRVRVVWTRRAEGSERYLLGTAFTVASARSAPASP